MKRVKRLLEGCLGLLLLVAIFFGNHTVVKAADTDEHRMNVVFVLDQSGSMAKTDAGALRYEAVDLFLGLATETGNYMGAVVFDDTIVLRQDITEMTGRDAKNILSNSIKSAKSNGDTDIGKAIELATQMLQSSGNPNLRSAIILLSDGNTDLPKDTTGTALTASEQSKQNAITAARNQGIKIHSICLNANGAAKKEELQEISDATGGVCVEVKSAEDLKEVFSQFYNIIYSTETIRLADSTIPENGELEIPFDIPLIGVEEANIIINTLNPNTSYNLFNPDGYGYIQAEMDAISIKAKTFTVIKLEKPKAGSWVLKVRGISGDQVKVDMVYNASLSIDLSCTSPNFELTVSNGEEITANLYNSGAVITDAEVYQNYPITLTVTDANTGATVFSSVMTSNNDSASCPLQLDQEGDYTIQASCTIDNVLVMSEAVACKVSAAASAPTTTTPTPKPSPAPAAKKTSILPIILIILLVLVIIAVIVVILLKTKSSGPIRGRIQFVGYNDGFLGTPQTFDGAKGKMFLNRYLEYREDVGIDLGKTYLKAGEKSTYIYLISPNGYYTDVNPEAKQKKIRLDAEMELQVSSDIEFGKYLKITYIPDDMGY